jgi:hypothetical protein
MRIVLLTSFACLILVACDSQNSGPIEEVPIDISSVNNNGASRTSERKISVATLFDESSNPESPEGCSPGGLDISLGGAKNVQRIRRLWHQNEDDSRYRLVTRSDFNYPTEYGPMACVCPGVCVIELVDTSRPPPDNFGIVVFSEGLKMGYSWVMKDVDLSNTRLAWASSTPFIEKVDARGNPIIIDDNKIDLCWIKWEPKTRTYVCKQ